ncbi:MAG: hypothetical protein QOJ25_2399 [Solirubrobacteraceae bacterium]|jgi:hypothetical protein|nr:hypothetical protein [Solirubrobacteraceae bacterium]
MLTKRSLIAVLAVTAVAAPSTASARFINNDPISAPAPSAAVIHQAQAGPASSSDFAWGDAGIGAAAAVALMGAGTLALGGRRRQGQATRTS